ncbi:hypothetical protein [Streptomyces sp. NPDC014623]|uniref:hypothetical protein n=1 Tax=Streptomyces sp. NPDC014623 TaxID=3364875 RepID=UPI0036F98E5C
MSGRPECAARDSYGQALGADQVEAVPPGSPGLTSGADLDEQVQHLSAGRRRRRESALMVRIRPNRRRSTSPRNRLCPVPWRTGGRPGAGPE